MSKKFLTPVQLPAGTANPSVGGLGALFFRTDLGQLVVYNGSSWIPIGPAPDASSIDGGTPSTITFSAVYDGGNASTF